MAAATVVVALGVEAVEGDLVDGVRGEEGVALGVEAVEGALVGGVRAGEAVLGAEGGVGTKIEDEKQLIRTLVLICMKVCLLSAGIQQVTGRTGTRQFYLSNLVAFSKPFGTRKQFRGTPCSSFGVFIQ